MMNKKIYGIVFIIVLYISIAQATVSSDFLDLINRERTSLGKVPLARNAQLEQAATLHAIDMDQNNYFSHTSLDGRSFSQRIKNAGYTPYSAIGENIAYHSGPPDASKVFTMWKNSPGHYSNMISSLFNEEGLGISYDGSRTYYVLDLGKRSGVTIPVNNTPINNTPVNNTPTTPPAPNPTPPQNNVTNTTLQGPTANFTFSYFNATSYRKIMIKAKLSEPSKAYYTIPNITKQICSNCPRFYITFKVPHNTFLPINFKLTNSKGQNSTYNFTL